MKYIDGIKNLDWGEVIHEYFLGISLHKSGSKLKGFRNHLWSAIINDNAKHIDITYYKPLTICFKDDMKTYFLPELEDFDNLDWIDGQPYEIIIIGGNK